MSFTLGKSSQGSWLYLLCNLKLKDSFCRTDMAILTCVCACVCMCSDSVLFWDLLKYLWGLEKLAFLSRWNCLKLWFTPTPMPVYLTRTRKIQRPFTKEHTTTEVSLLVQVMGYKLCWYLIMSRAFNKCQDEISGLYIHEHYILPIIFWNLKITEMLLILFVAFLC